MADNLEMSQPQDPNSWGVGESIESPFNMEGMLRACPNLLAHWQQHPFSFELDDKGRIIARYLVIPDTERGLR